MAALSASNPNPSSPPSIVAYHRAVDDELLERIYRLRYRSYRAEGTIAADPRARFTDPHDEDPNVFIFAVEAQDEIAASIRMHVCSPEMPFGPGLEVFPDVLGPMIDRGESFVDPTRFVVDQALRRSLGHLPFATVRLAAMAAEHFDADHVLATVRSEHVPFYRRFCDMELITEPRDYPALARPICLMAGRSEEIRESVYPRQGHFASTHRERIRLFGLSRMIGLGMADPPAFENRRVLVPARAQAARREG